MENQENRYKNSDDLDFAQFFQWLGRGVKKAANSVVYALATVRNLFFTNKLFFAGVILMGLSVGATYYFLLVKKYYQSTMVLSCDYLNNQILENTIDKLNLLCAEPEREGLSELLLLDHNTAKNIVSFEFKPFVSEDDVVELEVLKEQLNNLAAQKKDLVEKVMAKLTIVNRNAYLISVKVYNPDIVKPLEKALINYFRQNEYIKRRTEVHRSNLEERKAKLERESRKMDSLKAVLYQNYQSLGKTSRGTGNVYLGDEKLANPLDVFREDLVLNKEILAIEQELHVSSDFEVIDGFTTFKQPESSSLFKILFIAFWISLLMGYLIIAAWRIDQYLAAYIPKT